jgi:hypothetical protein
MVHQRGTKVFMEVPLFATRKGYQRNGLARLLNAGLTQFCMDHLRECSFLMVSADSLAVPFWRHLGFAEISKRESQSYAFDYQTHCIKFKDSLTMTLPIPKLKEDRDNRLRLWALSHPQDHHTAFQGVEEGSAPKEESLLESVSRSIFVMDVLAKLPRFVLEGPPYLVHE